MQQTLENIQNSEMCPKLRTYKLFKQEYNLENYLLQLKDLRYIKVLIKFRISSHSITIETARYEREKLQCGKIVKLHASKRVSKICNLGKVEDEQHFIKECPAYKLECNALFKMAI